MKARTKIQKSKYMLGRITWNDSGWERLQQEEYGRPDEEGSLHWTPLNFDFDKKVDTYTHVFGYVAQRQGKDFWPRRLEEPGFVFFVTMNPYSGEQLVGIYGNAKLVEPVEKIPQYNNKELGRGHIRANLKAEKSKSLRFPVPLFGGPYLDYVEDKGKKAKNLLPQAGIRYIQQDLASIIITDEIEAVLNTPGDNEGALNKLYSIYELITGHAYDNKERTGGKSESENKYVDVEMSRGQLINWFTNDKQEHTKSVMTTIERLTRAKTFTDNLKKLCDYKCEMCGIRIPIKNNKFYIETAHIDPKSDGGSETLDNLLILCPNHHKEFDHGNRNSKERTTDGFKFELNGKIYEIDLRLEKRGWQVQ